MWIDCRETFLRMWRWIKDVFSNHSKVFLHDHSITHPSLFIPLVYCLLNCVHYILYTNSVAIWDLIPIIFFFISIFYQKPFTVIKYWEHKMLKILAFLLLLVYLSLTCAMHCGIQFPTQVCANSLFFHVVAIRVNSYKFISIFSCHWCHWFFVDNIKPFWLIHKFTQITNHSLFSLHSVYCVTLHHSSEV